MSDRAARAKVRSADPAFEPARSGGYIPPQPSDIFATAARSHPDALAIQTSAIDDVDRARMDEYALLATLLRQAPDGVLLEGLSGIRGDSTPLGVAHAALARAAEETDPERLDREFFALFVGVGRGELLPYGSYYLTGFLNERPLARLREDLRLLGVSRTEDQAEPEDHASILCEIMAGLAGGSLATAPDAQKRFFQKHLAPWIGRFFADLEQIKDSNFYRRVGTVGRLFIEIETEAFALPS
jgi:TorA maturation chaperone TorD